MRIRKATIAGATALAVAFGGTTVATAAEGSSNDSASNSSASAGEQQGTQKAGGSSALGLSLIHISEPTRLRQLSRMPSSA